MFQLHYAVYSHPGMIREINEDNYYINDSWKKQIEQNISRTEGNTDEGYLAASVCDGMGGEALGEAASLCASEAIHEFVMQENAGVYRKKRQNNLSLLAEHANAKICEFMNYANKRIGSTITLMEFCRNTVTVMNLGDSPGFQLRDGCLKKLSMDHTVVGRMVQIGQLTEEEARNHPMRHQITQYLGIFEEEMILEPFVSEKIRVMPGDIYLICSDGLTDMLSHQEICEILQEPQKVEEKAEKLVDAALSAGGKDNVTVVLVEVGKSVSRLKQVRKLWDQKIRKPEKNRK